jgi:Uma2 family endonuclease
VRSSRIPASGIPNGFWPGAPDLAIDVLSPWDAFLPTMERVEDLLRAGALLYWVIDPAERMAGVFCPDMPDTLAGEDGVLDGGDVVPGFAITLRDVLP